MARDIAKLRENNRLYMERQRRDPAGKVRLQATAKRSWANGGAQRQADYLARLKKTDFFRWKARKSYVTLTAEELRGLWDSQAGLCALTGRPLGDDPEIDHIVPLSRGGDGSVTNSRWVTRDANQAKHSLLDAEFLELCRDVARHLG